MGIMEMNIAIMVNLQLNEVKTNVDKLLVQQSPTKAQEDHAYKILLTLYIKFIKAFQHTDRNMIVQQNN